MVKKEGGEYSFQEVAADGKRTDATVSHAIALEYAQQAAEKSIKAVFVKRGETFPFSHDLERLIQLLEANGHKVPKYVHRAKELTRFAHVTRYPGLADPVTQSAHRRAVRIAEAVLRWAERQIEPQAKKPRGTK